MSVRRAGALLAYAIALALAIAILLRDTPGYVGRTVDGGYEGDITHYVYWTRLVTLGGVQDAYGGAWPETFAVYPPVTLYAYQLVGTLYQLVADPQFALDRALNDAALASGIKAVAVGFHLLVAVAIYLLATRLANRQRALAAASLYVLNPAALFDAAHWGQPDGAHSLFSVLAVGLLSLGVPVWGWAAMALAALAKPQAWAILPLLTLATWRDWGLRGLVRGGGVAAGVALVVLLPFIVTGRLGEFLRLPGAISSVMPVVTANAHNWWWLVYASQGVDPLFTTDTARLVGPLSIRTIAGIFVGAQFLYTYWLYWTRRAGLAEAAALGALGWFVFTTQAHENHLFFAIPLLALAWPTRPRLLVPFAVLTCTVFLNMALHDLLVMEALQLEATPLQQTTRTLNALVNLTCFAVWSAWAALRPRHTPSRLST